MMREEARRTLLREYDKWAKDHPEDATKKDDVVFFTYLHKERTDLLDFHAVGGDKWATVHGWLYYTGRVKRLGGGEEGCGKNDRLTQDALAAPISRGNRVEAPRLVQPNRR
jgi:hypothetical protein